MKRPNAPAAPAIPKQKASPRATIPSPVKLNITAGEITGSDRIVVYGTGGIGKSTLCAFLPAPIFLDIERSTNRINVARDTAADWAELRGKLAAIAQAPPQGVRSIVIDTATVAEEFAKEHVIAERKTEKGKRVDSIEGFGWGKGWQFIYDEFCGLLADCDRIAAQGLNICLIAHEVSTPVPNPAGEDFIRWEPHLYSGDKKGRGSIRERVKEWSDHVLFIGYDVFVEDGKGSGSGTRTIYTQELPTHIAKSRAKQLTIPFDLQDPAAIWRELGIS
tara:strand:- start:4356 stop:5183 length:828 start_codon:yes stop_codon:yes gene_type:complete